MSDLAQLVDLDAYLARRVTVRNAGGGRGYDAGVRAFDCPLCGDARGRGWLHVVGFAAGCWNAGCAAEPRLLGGAVEWVRRVEGLRSRGEAWALLHREYPRSVAAPRPPDRSAPTQDFCRLPDGLEAAWRTGGVLEREALAFMARQWGLGPEDAERWGLGRARAGRYAYRVVIPVVMGGRAVSFQARSFRGAEPKYLTARSERLGDLPPECGRPASALLFNVDAARSGADVVLVEGAGDVMGFARRARSRWVPVALLGQALTPQKLALLAALRPRAVAVALDAGEAEARRAQDHAADLSAWDVAPTVVMAQWRGAKDAGGGADLEVVGGVSFARVVRERVGG